MGQIKCEICVHIQRKKIVKTKMIEPAFSVMPFVSNVFVVLFISFKCVIHCCGWVCVCVIFFGWLMLLLLLFYYHTYNTRPLQHLKKTSLCLVPFLLSLRWLYVIFQTLIHTHTFNGNTVCVFVCLFSCFLLYRLIFFVLVVFLSAVLYFSQFILEKLNGWSVTATWIYSFKTSV